MNPVVNYILNVIKKYLSYTILMNFEIWMEIIPFVSHTIFIF